jgi:hypothetical protein
MKLRYELLDTHHPGWRGQRFTSLDRARRELAQAIPPGRFVLYDRQEREEMAP